MNITCTCCGREIEVDDELIVGQHVRCPYCEKKFSYIVDETPFSTARLEYALSECRKDPKDELYYSRAPKGARLYIAMIFYGKVFGKEVDREKYFELLSEIEPQLKAQDLEYLLANEDDEELKAYFQRLLARLNIGQPTKPVQGVSRLKKIDRPEDGAFRGREEMLGKAHEIRQRAAVDQKNRERRLKIVGMITTTACILAVMVVGLLLFNNWSNHVEEEKKIEAEREKIRLEDEKRQNKKELEEQRLELEQKRIAQKQRNDELRMLAQRKESVSESKKDEITSIEVSKTDRMLKTDNNAISQSATKENGAVVDVAVRRKEAIAAFSGRKIILWDDLSSNLRPGVVEQMAFCALPSEEGKEISIYELCGGRGESKRITLLGAEGVSSKINDSEFEDKVAKTGGLYAMGEKVVVRALSVRTEAPLDISSEEPLILGKLVYGSIFPLMQQYKVDLSEARYVVEMTIRSEKVVVANVVADEPINSRRFDEAAKRYLIKEKQEKIGPQSVSVKKPPVTVEFNDGVRIQKVAGGLTRIPRRNPYENVDKMCTKGYWKSAQRCHCSGCKNKRAELKFLQQWDPLKEKAEEQEREQEEYKVKLKKAIDKAKNEVTVSEQEIRRFLKRAKVSFRKLSPDDVQDDDKRVETSNEEQCDIPNWKGDVVPVGIMNQVNAELKVKSFCGISFGIVDGSRSGILRKPFRGFDRYDASRTRFRRINRISIHREIEGGADSESIRKEMKNIVASLERKYAVKFDLRDSSDDRIVYCASTEDLEININGNLNGSVRFTIDFYNKQVDRQDDRIEKMKQKPAIDLSEKTDEGVL